MKYINFNKKSFELKIPESYPNDPPELTLF